MPRIRAESIAAHKEATRTDLLEAAAALFRAQGYGETTLADITSLAGIGRTTVYEYFTDKEDVLVQLVEDTVPGVVEEMLSGLPDSLTVSERLGELVVRGLEFAATDHALGSTLMRELPSLSPAAQRRIRAVHAPLEQEIVDLCRRGMENGEFREFDPMDAGRLVYGVMMAGSQSLIRDPDAKQRMHEVADTVTAFVFRGLSA